MTGWAGCLRLDGVYSARRLRLCCAKVGARLSINSDGGPVVGATARVEHLM